MATVAAGDAASRALVELNAQRARHGAPPLALSADLTSYAQKWAERGVFEHSHGPHGENLAWSKGMYRDASAAIHGGVLSWYSEASKYDFSKPGFSMETGHFTQNVWKGSTAVGFGAKLLPDGAWLVVASFAPPGNVTNTGYFTANVLPDQHPTGGPSLTPQQPAAARVPSVTATAPARAEDAAVASRALAELNTQRARHGAPPVMLSAELTSYAQKWADRGVFEHSRGPHGENLAWSSGMYHEASAAMHGGVLSWYSEASKYDYAKPDFSMETGHFTQNVWKSTTAVGFGAKLLPDGAWLVVASFAPHGNMMGSFAANVLAPRGQH